MQYHTVFMQQALQLAIEGVRKGIGGPFGAVVVHKGHVVGQGCNRVVSTFDPTAHAEVVAIRDACYRLRTYQLTDCDLYTTCEPCPMCLGAIYWARPAKVFYAATRHDAAAAGFDDALIYEQASLPPQQRLLPFIHLPTPQVQQVFDLWHTLPDKTPY